MVSLFIYKGTPKKYVVCSKKVNNPMCHVMNDQFKILVIEVRESRKGFTCGNILHSADPPMAHLDSVYTLLTLDWEKP